MEVPPSKSEAMEVPTSKGEAMKVPSSKDEAMEESSGTQEARVGLTAVHTRPAGDAWHITDNVEDEFDWNEDGMVSYTYCTGIIEEIELKEPRV